jgi:hypothetical protein
MFKKIIPILIILLLSGCSDPKYRSTINYEFQSGFTIAEKRNSMGNIPPYSFSIVKKNKDLNDMTFMVSAITRDSSPEIILDLPAAKLKFNGVDYSSLHQNDVEMNGTVDPKNGRTTFEQISIRFPYVKALRRGEKLKFSEDENSSDTFEIVIPAKLNKKHENITFTYVRRDISGERRFGKLLSF